ncbi:MAG: carboxypeptidase regulatory-like domain-containing protein [Planctomycetes bacterium]|nr:carboxypeptidase regulatory-like domain-containing protein [Planctomycetota bacterium]
MTLERRRGRGAVVGVLAITVALAVGLALVLRRSEPARTEAALPTPRPAVSSPELAGAPSAEPISVRHGAGVPAEPTAPLTAEERAARFVGVGRVRGSLRTAPPNLPLPERWTIVLEPSRSLVTSERVERRELACGSDGSFVFENVPLGGYDLSVDAGDLDCPTRPLLLAKPESQDVFLVLVARLAGELTGRVVDAEGLGAEGCAVALISERDGRTLETRTGPGGEYRFERVHDGDWRLCAGPATNPLLAPRDVSFRGPRLTAPDFQLPACGELSVLVQDDRGLPLEGVSISGYGKQGGAAREKTDANGAVRLRWLPLGDFTVLLEREGLGALKQHVTILAGEPTETRFVVAP